MKSGKLLFLLVILMLICTSTVMAKKGSIKLLAVSETADGYKGDVADLYLDVRSGTGRVFIDTLPASKLDTQISTRFAKNMACKYADIDCNKYDFFYMIRSDTTIVGGPSAGAAATVLTISVLKGLKPDESVAITGTINSGNLIGRVGGLKSKISSASEFGITKVLIPYGESIIKEQNSTFNLTEFGLNHSVEVLEVADIDEALYEFTGLNFKKENNGVRMSQGYEQTMSILADQFCNRSMKLFDKVSDLDITKEDHGNASIFAKDRADNLTNDGFIALKNGKQYSAASYCFGANVHYSFVLLNYKDMNRSMLLDAYNRTENKIDDINQVLDNYNIKTITDLQAFMVVKDRLIAAEDYLNSSKESLNSDNPRDAIYSFAYALERVNSAISWSEFLGKPGKVFDLDPEHLRSSCLTKLREAEEHFHYVQLFFPGILGDTLKDIRRGYDDYEKQDYELCLFKASIAKAEVNSVLSSMGVDEEDIFGLVSRKTDAAARVIIKQQQDDIFPLLGYSYYEYAESLKDSDPYSALLYSEYSLEIGNLDIYFETGTRPSFNWTPFAWVLLFFAGILLGFLVTELIHFLLRFNKPKPSKSRKKKR